MSKWGGGRPPQYGAGGRHICAIRSVASLVRVAALKQTWRGEKLEELGLTAAWCLDRQMEEWQTKTLRCTHVYNEDPTAENKATQCCS